MHNSCLLKTWQFCDDEDFLWSFHFGHKTPQQLLSKINMQSSAAAVGRGGV